MIYHFSLQHLEMKGIRSVQGRDVSSALRAEKVLIVALWRKSQGIVS